MTLLEGILSVTLALLFIYLMIGLFLWLSNYEVVKNGLELDQITKPPLWLLGLTAVIAWPWMHYREYREKWEEYQNGQRKKDFYHITNAPRRSNEASERTSGISGLYLRQSVDQSHKERVASYFDPYEYASRDESFPMALQELVGGDDSDRVPEYPSTERDIFFKWGPSDTTPSPVETPSAAPLKEESFGSSQSDSGMGSDYSGSSGSDSCSSSYDSGSSSCGGE